MPSGEKTGELSIPLPSISACSSPPMVRRQISAPALYPRMKTMAPSGPSVGWVSAASSMVNCTVSVTMPVPSSVTRQRSVEPSRSDAKTIDSPSAPQSGSRSHAGPLVIWTILSARKPAPSSTIPDIQISPLISKTSRLSGPYDGLRIQLRSSISCKPVAALTAPLGNQSRTTKPLMRRAQTIVRRSISIPRLVSKFPRI